MSSDAPPSSRDPGLFPSADHLALERAARSPGSISLSDSTRGDTPDALAPLFAADGLKDADKPQLIARIAFLEQELEASRRKRVALERYACDTEMRRKKLHDENLRLARQVSELQQWRQDNAYRACTHDATK